MRAIGLALLLVAAGCQGAAPVEAAQEAAPTGELCQHGVLAGACPKCQPALAVVYQSKGDWCAEHGLPESFCPACHPERQGRPLPKAAKPEADRASPEGDAGPPDGLPVVLRSPDAARLAGLEVARVTSTPWVREVAAPVELQYDATRRAVVSARSPGVLRTLHADVGARVEPGRPLAVIESVQIGADQARMSAAKARLALAQAALKREKGLRAQQLNTVRDVLAAQQEVGAARAEVAVGEAALKIAGSGAAGEGQYTVTSPLGGTLTKRHASIGNLVEAGGPIFEVVDASSVWAEVAVPESSLGVVAATQDVVLTFDGLGDREWLGAIAWIAPELDPMTRTASARVPLSNVDGVLRAHMYGEARIQVASPTPRVRVQRAAVQDVQGARVVFVRKADDLYELRRVRLEADGDGATLVAASGLAPGDDVVTTGSFLLKTEVMKGSIGAGCCDGD